MGFFRRREPLHERLAREAGMVAPDAAPIATRPAWLETGIHGVPRPRDWEATITAEAPDVEGAAVRFVTLPDGTVLVEDGPDTSLEPLATAVEEQLPPPYRARAVRQNETLWAIQARRIEVLEIPDGPAGDEIVVTHTADGTTFAVDDEKQFGAVPVLEQRGEREGAEYTVHAERLDGDLWEVRASAL
ncbi:MAG: hypothetical protein ABSB24_06950 [Gaiellaceae bacterium]